MLALFQSPMIRTANVAFEILVLCVLYGQNLSGQEFHSADEEFRSAMKVYAAQLAAWEALQVSIPELKEQLAGIEEDLEAVQAKQPEAPVFRPRQWQTVDLKFRTTATLIETDGRIAKLQKSDKQIISVDREILIAEDRIYIEEAWEQIQETEQKIEKWKAERGQLVSRRDEISGKLKEANAPRPAAPDRRKIENEFEMRQRGLEARPVAGAPNYFSIQLPDGTEIQIRLSAPVIYKLAGSPKYLGREFCQVLIQQDNDIWEDHGVLNLNGTPVPVRKRAGTIQFAIEQKPEIGDWYTFGQPGETFISIQIAEHRIWVPFTVTELPYREGTPAARILQELGFPNPKATHFTSWPDTKTFDGLIYSPSASESIIQAEHWRFGKLPYAVLAIVNDKLDDVGSYVESD